MQNTFRIGTTANGVFDKNDVEAMPVMQPTKGNTYKSYHWSVRECKYTEGHTAEYLGNGEWSDRCTTAFKWAEFIVEQK